MVVFTKAQKRHLFAIYRTGWGHLNNRSHLVLERLYGWWRWRVVEDPLMGPRELTDTGLVAIGAIGRCGECAACQEALLDLESASPCRSAPAREPKGGV